MVPGAKISVAAEASGYPAGGIAEPDSHSMFVVMTVRGQLCGIPVLSVRDIIVTHGMTRIPLAPPEVAGSMNLRGRIVTAIDLRRRLNLPARESGQAGMSVVVDRQGELYSLVVDSVREVIEFNDRQLEPNPPTLAAAWREFSSGIYRLQSELLVVLNTERVLAIN
jgi:purine-binding chemotaxis protein CheW